MKYIPKSIKNEPESLRQYRTTTPNAVYNGGFDKQDLRKKLLEEQGYLCAYCMGPISDEMNADFKPKIEIEHYKSRQLHKDLELSYLNMLGVCNGVSTDYPQRDEHYHCDKTKQPNGKSNGLVSLRKLDPRKKEVEALLIYLPDGRIKSVNNDSDVEHDLNIVLNLNNGPLAKRRKIVIDVALDLLKGKKTHQDWTQPFILQEAKTWTEKKQGKFKQYCMAAVYFLQNLAKQPKYN